MRWTPVGLVYNNLEAYNSGVQHVPTFAVQCVKLEDAVGFLRDVGCGHSVSWRPPEWWRLVII